MNHRFFLSHYSGDKNIADIVSRTLKRITLNQIVPWFSSDESGTGGLKPGNLWFNEILDKIQKSKAVVAILTPNSISRPWIYFETGIGQALEDCEVMPICIGIDRSKVYPPLGLYQCYQLSDYRSFKEFISKLLGKFDIPFDEDAFKPILETALTEILGIKLEEKEDEATPKVVEIIDDLRNHIDKRFLEILEKPAMNRTQNDLASADANIRTNENDDYLASYTVPVEINLDDHKSKHYIEIRYDNTFGDIITNLYFIIEEYVQPYRYLQSWILREKKSRRLLVIREVGDLIPARIIFKPEFQLEIISLPQSYDP
ncbi:toll/interleukin-1 receptor domain-containing protein [Aquimarina sp. RZ0]|uniref:toll/interleukin-1 receptor domain-containing protein n=1 Tax=Aquimarina sp. RZ0 TaxID=2607730 RepID=UPI0011F1CFC7|nr:toll/interleukin-1 receptor domain-containing protein [Aquimarina sp. RZ0]KAA1245657.1 toll/interleukin-1 receptor domain-containing protein [Aquimarina sp. RZ0]